MRDGACRRAMFQRHSGSLEAPTVFRAVCATVAFSVASSGFRVMAECQGLFGVRGAESERVNAH